MLSDPMRLSGFVPALPADRGPPLGPDEAAPIPGERVTFDDVLKALNPLHHVPVVGTIYRAVSGEEIQPAFRVLGGALFGGFSGMLSAAAMAAIEEFKPVPRLLAAIRGEPDPLLAAPDALAAAQGADAPG